MNISSQCEAIRLLDRLGMKYEVINKYILKCNEPRIEIRTYDDSFDVSFYPKKIICSKTAERKGKFFVWYCREIKELENDMLMLTRLL